MKYLLIPLLFLLTGCPEDKKINTQLGEVAANSRYTVNRVGMFEDNLAYYNKRGIYEITDTQTGQVYLGISGIGITELSKHGKNNSIEDER